MGKCHIYQHRIMTKELDPGEVMEIVDQLAPTIFAALEGRHPSIQGGVRFVGPDGGSVSFTRMGIVFHGCVSAR